MTISRRIEGWTLAECAYSKLGGVRASDNVVTCFGSRPRRIDRFCSPKHSGLASIPRRTGL
jgi:hypothetical protein